MNTIIGQTRLCTILALRGAKTMTRLNSRGKVNVINIRTKFNSRFYNKLLSPIDRSLDCDLSSNTQFSRPNFSFSLGSSLHSPLSSFSLLFTSFISLLSQVDQNLLLFLMLEQEPSYSSNITCIPGESYNGN